MSGQAILALPELGTAQPQLVITYKHDDMIVYTDVSKHVHIYKYVYMNVYKEAFYLESYKAFL
jgi:hypothetical protein